METRSIPRIILSHLISLIILIVLLIVANNYVNTNNQTVLDVIAFFNLNILLIVVMTIIFMIADIFYTFIIPLSFPAPVFSAIGSLFVVKFIFNFFILLDTIMKINIFDSIMWTTWIIYPVVFIIALISGFLQLLYRAVTIPKPEQKEEKIINITPKKTSGRSWEDIGDEFRNLLYDSFSSLRTALNRKKKKK